MLRQPPWMKARRRAARRHRVVIRRNRDLNRDVGRLIRRPSVHANPGPRGGGIAISRQLLRRFKEGPAPSGLSGGWGRAERAQRCHDHHCSGKAEPFWMFLACDISGQARGPDYCSNCVGPAGRSTTACRLGIDGSRAVVRTRSSALPNCQAASSSFSRPRSSPAHARCQQWLSN